jgi:hypothetical protein
MRLNRCIQEHRNKIATSQKPTVSRENRPLALGTATALSRNYGGLCYFCHMPGLGPSLEACAFACAPEGHPRATTEHVTASAFEKDTDDDQMRPGYSRMENAAPQRLEWAEAKHGSSVVVSASILTELRSRTLSRPTRGGPHRSLSVTSYEIVRPSRLGGPGCKTFKELKTQRSSEDGGFSCSRSRSA